MSADRPDLLVVGGGPAGAALAALVAAAGARVLVVERERFPRDKVCGEFVAAEGCRVLERLGILDALVRGGAPRIEACRLAVRSGARIDAPLPPIDAAGGAARGIPRAVLDAALLDAAVRRGAEVRQRWEAAGFDVDGGRVVGAALRPVGGGRGTTVRPRVIVAADGRRSRLGRLLHPSAGDPTRTTGASWFGVKAHFVADAARLGGRVELHVFPGGYAGLCAVGHDLVNLCCLVRVDRLRRAGGSPDRLVAEQVLRAPAVAATLAGARRAGRWHTIGPLAWGPRRPAAAGALFVGDAAGTLDPFTGEGMSNALSGAELAAPFVLDALDRGGVDAGISAAWTARWHRAFAPVTRRARGLGRLLERPRLAAAAVRVLAGPARTLAPRLVAGTRTGVVA